MKSSQIAQTMGTLDFKEIINRLLGEIEEEEVAISLLTIYHQNKEELDFFEETDRKRVEEILKELAEDSKHHKKVVERIVSKLGDEVS